MGTFAEFSISEPIFPWGSILDSYPSTRIEIERAVPFGVPVYYCWISGQDHDRVIDELRQYSNASVVTTVDELSDRTLVRIEERTDGNEFLWIVEEAGARLLSVTGQRKNWSVTLHFPDNGTVSTFHERCREHGMSAQLRTIYDTDPRDRTSLYGLTPEQFETLREAHRQGYFEVPRRTTITELADQFGVSDQAVSERLRRALTSLVETTLTDEEDRERES